MERRTSEAAIEAAALQGRCAMHRLSWYQIKSQDLLGMAPQVLRVRMGE
jgi:hypothetical protein